VETNLIENFCKYLESEGIVSTYETKDLLCYGAGMKARKAITTIFDQVDVQLREDGFTSTSREGKDAEWPRLMIGHPEWRKIFGTGKNQKISLWFTIPGVWEADRYDFSFEIELWLEEQGNDWQLTKSKLPKWFEALKSQGFDWTVYRTWNRSGQNTAASEIQSVPKRINAFRRGGENFLNQSAPQDGDELVKMIIKATRKYAEIVSSLKP
jgi:hypothetical protein